MRRSFLVCLITVAWSIPQVSAQAPAGSDVLLEQLASDSSHDREQAITEILRRRVELRTWLEEQAKGADAEVRDNIDLVRKLIELGLTEKVSTQLRAYVERFIAGTFEQRMDVVSFLAGKHAHFLLGVVVPEIATTIDDRQRERLWREVLWSLRYWSRGRADLAGTILVEIVEESDERVRESMIRGFADAYDSLLGAEVADWIVEHDELDSLLVIFEQTDHYCRFGMLEAVAKSIEDPEHARHRSRGLELWNLAVRDEHLRGESLAKQLMLCKWFRAELLRDDPADPLQPLVENIPEGFLYEALYDAFVEGMVVDMVKCDQFALLPPLMKHVPDDQWEVLLRRIGRSSTFRNGVWQRDDMIRTLRAFYNVQERRLRKSLAEYAVCSSDVSRHGDVLVRYLQAVAKNDPKLEARFCVRMFRGANIDRIAATSPMLQTLLDELKRPNAELLKSILTKGSSGPFHIAKAGHGREIIDAVRSVSDPEQRWQLKKTALDSRPLRELMSADEIEQMSMSLLPGDAHDVQDQQRPGVPRDDSP